MFILFLTFLNLSGVFGNVCNGTKCVYFEYLNITLPIECDNSKYDYVYQKCLPICLKGQFRNGSLCSNCTENCEVCSNSKLCKICVSNYTKNSNGKCERICSNKQFSKQNLCINCHSACLTCYGPLIFHCKTCDNEYVLNKGKCFSKPHALFPNYYKRTPIDLLWVECPIGCSVCLSDNECYQCFNGYTLTKGKTYSKCVLNRN